MPRGLPVPGCCGHTAAAVAGATPAKRAPTAWPGSQLHQQETGRGARIAHTVDGPHIGPQRR